MQTLAHRMRVLTLPCAAVLAALAFSAPASATTVSPAPPIASPGVPGPVVTSQGIIMRDGGICDPIRHMGC